MPRSRARNCVGDAHDHMVVVKFGMALGVITDEVEWCSGALLWRHFSMRAMFEELAKERLGMVADACRFRAADLCVGKSFADRGGGQVIEPIVLFRCSVPIADVGLVPHFP